MLIEISAAVRSSAAGGCATSTSWTPSLRSALLPKEQQLYRLYKQATREPYSFLFVYYLKPRNEMFYKRFEERFALEKTPMGAALSFLGQKLFASSTLINAKCENISGCTSVAAVQPTIRRTGGLLRKGMTTIYVDSRKRVAGSDFEVDWESRCTCPARRLQNPLGRQLFVHRGRYLYWVDAALGTLNWALARTWAAWASSNFATALSVAYDGNDLELRQQFPNAARRPRRLSSQESSSAPCACWRGSPLMTG